VGSHLSAEVNLVCQDAAGATAAAEQLNRVLKDARQDLDRQEGVPDIFRKLLSSIQFTASGTRVTAALRGIDPDELTRGFDQLSDRARQQRRRNQEMWEKDRQQLEKGWKK
jgi:hypothetical protein